MEAGACHVDQLRSRQASALLAHAAAPNLRRESPVPLSTAEVGLPAAPDQDAAILTQESLAPESVPEGQPRRRAKAAPNLLTDYIELFKARVTALVVITAWAGFYLGSVRSGIPSFHIGLLETLAGIGLISAGAAALNEVLERKSDARMIRTAGRPLATGRISLPHGLLVAFATTLLGSLILLRFTNLVTVALGLLTVFTYVAVYTPLKCAPRSRPSSARSRAPWVRCWAGPPHAAHRVAGRRAVRHPLCLAVSPLHGHRLALSRRLRQRRHPHAAGGASPMAGPPSSKR